MTGGFSELRLAARRLARSPYAALGAIATLAVAIGANSAAFSVYRAVVGRPLPFPEPDRLVQVDELWHGELNDVSPPDFFDYRARADRFAKLGASVSSSVALAGDGPAEQLARAEIGGDFFAALGAPPRLGRLLEAADSEGAGRRTVAIAEGLWKRRFGGDPAVVGRTIRLDGEPYEVVGVVAAGREIPRGTEVWMPLVLAPEAYLQQRGAHYLTVVGRLAPGATVAAAAEQVRAMAARFARDFPDSNRDTSATARLLREAMVGSVRSTVLLLVAAGALVLLVASANLAHLFLARAVGRERELAIRAALGAGRGRLVREVVAESLVLAAAGGGLGLLLASGAGAWLARLRNAGIPLLDETRIDPAVVAATALFALAAAAIASLLPALRVARHHQLGAQIGSDARVAGLDRARQRVLHGLLVGEMALATAVLAAAALVTKSLLLLGAVDLGLDPRGAMTFALSLPDAGYQPPERAAEFARRLEERLAHLPGVRSAGAIFGMPFTGFGYSISSRAIDGRTLDPAEGDRLTVDVRVATPGYLPASGMRLVAGRNFTDADRAGAPAVVLVNQTAARLFFPDGSPLGHSLELATRLGISKDWPRIGGEVVGVVADVPANGPARPAPPTVYAAHAQAPVGFLAFAVRTDGDARALAPAIPGLVAELDPDLPIFRLRPLAELARDSFARQRLTAAVVSVFGLAAALLAGVGIFSMLAYTVASRRRELGVRMALGARPSRLAIEVGRGSTLLAGVGIAGGLAAALAAGAFLRGLLFGVAPNDPATLALVAVAAIGVVLLAVLGPALRAARLDPSTVLRED